MWLSGDHYKWRAMRANGVDERFITGGASDWEKFERWAATVPYTMGNPLYHWTHLELRRVFGVTDLLSPETARGIYDRCGEMLRSSEFSVRNLMRRFRVEVVCTTDDPADSLESHVALRDEGFDIKVLPTWRPDKAVAVGEAGDFLGDYCWRLGAAAGVDIHDEASFTEALGRRHDFFHSVGCRLSDHGSVGFDFGEWMYRGALMDHAKGWVQQFHYGAQRDNNARLLKHIGADCGCDSIGDQAVAADMARFFDRLDAEDRLAKTIVYNLDPTDNYLVATMVGNYQQGPSAGKMQMGSGWWFCDQKEGMERQLGALSSLGLLSRFVGMLTDSRSFVSYPRHEYFRRILCNLIGGDIEKGLLPASEMEFIGRMVEGICYFNAKEYFNL